MDTAHLSALLLASLVLFGCGAGEPQWSTDGAQVTYVSCDESLVYKAVQYTVKTGESEILLELQAAAPKEFDLSESVGSLYDNAVENGDSPGKALAGSLVMGLIGGGMAAPFMGVASASTLLLHPSGEDAGQGWFIQDGNFRVCQMGDGSEIEPEGLASLVESAQWEFGGIRDGSVFYSRMAKAHKGEALLVGYDIDNESVVRQETKGIGAGDHILLACSEGRYVVGQYLRDKYSIWFAERSGDLPLGFEEIYVDWDPTEFPTAALHGDLVAVGVAGDDSGKEASVRVIDVRHKDKPHRTFSIPGEALCMEFCFERKGEALWAFPLIAASDGATVSPDSDLFVRIDFADESVECWSAGDFKIEEGISAVVASVLSPIEDIIALQLYPLPGQASLLLLDLRDEEPSAQLIGEN